MIRICLGCQRRAEADFLESIPDLFKSSQTEFEAAAAIIEKSLERRGWNRPLQKPPSYH